jgi:hypothetical protein
MAFNILSGETTKQSWARGDVAVELAVARAKKLPWGKIAGGACIVVGAALILSPEKKSTGRHLDRWDDETTEIPREKMRELVYGRR